MNRADSHRLVHDFFAAVTAGELPDALLTPDMQGWTTTQGALSKAAYEQAIRVRNGRIAAVAEHFNALVVQEKMFPLVRGAVPKS